MDQSNDQSPSPSNVPGNSSGENDNPIINSEISSSSTSSHLANTIMPEIYVPQTSRELTPEEVSLSFFLGDCKFLPLKRIMTLEYAFY